MTREIKQPIRSSMGFRDQVQPVLREAYSSPLIDRMRTDQFRLNAGRITFYLAEEFGFCYGVDRAVELAYETSRMFPGKRIFLTSEIIHNPQVNSKLKENGIHFLDDPEWGALGFDAITKDDIAVIPAFGTTTQDLERLKQKGCTLVDTTCGSVIHVWKRVEKYAKDGFTAVVHGKYAHEETRATCSRATQVPGGKYLVVRNITQTQKVCEFISGKNPPPLPLPSGERIKVRGNREKFLEVFSPQAMSAGFDPDQDLVRIGCANQTTMLLEESLQIAEMLQNAMKERYGAEELGDHFRHFDTICSATQERQDAVLKLVRNGVDLMLVIGGYNSSNTGHLVEMASEHCPAYHIQDPTDILSKDRIRYQPVHQKKTVIKKGWLPSGAVKIGVTAGASTPNKVIEEAIRRVITLSGCEIQPRHCQ